MKKLVLVRHGQTPKNVSGLLHGLSDESLLDKVGKAQMRQAGQKIVKEFWPFGLFHSQEARARQSARIIAEISGVTAIEVNGLEERDWGEFEGRPWSEVRRILDKLDLEARYVYRPPSGETWQEFEQRTVEALTVKLRESEDKNVVLVTHGGVIRALMPFLLDVSREESFKYSPRNASLTIFEYKDGCFSPILIDDASHLSDEGL